MDIMANLLPVACNPVPVFLIPAVVMGAASSCASIPFICPYWRYAIVASISVWRCGILEFNVPLDTVYVISEMGVWRVKMESTRVLAASASVDTAAVVASVSTVHDDSAVM